MRPNLIHRLAISDDYRGFVVDHLQRRSAEGELAWELPPAVDQALVAAGLKAKRGPWTLATVRSRRPPSPYPKWRRGGPLATTDWKASVTAPCSAPGLPAVGAGAARLPRPTCVTCAASARRGVYIGWSTARLSRPVLPPRQPRTSRCWTGPPRPAGLAAGIRDQRRRDLPPAVEAPDGPCPVLERRMKLRRLRVRKAARPTSTGFSRYSKRRARTRVFPIRATAPSDCKWWW